MVTYRCKVCGTVFKDTAFQTAYDLAAMHHKKYHPHARFSLLMEPGGYIHY